jgi:hypothetical protein
MAAAHVPAAGRYVALFLLGILCAPAGNADEVSNDAETAVVLEEGTLALRKVWVARARFSHPQRLSGSVGILMARLPADFECATVCDLRGWIFQVEPGWSGGQVSAGYGMVIGDQRPETTYVANVYVGYAVKGAVLRTWGDSPVEPSTQTFVGVETEVTITRVNLSLGLFRSVSDHHSGDRWLVAGGLGWGF